MSKDQLNAFIEKAKSDPELVKKLSACSDEQCVLIAKESGCAISGTEGGEQDIYDGNIIVSNPQIHETILKEIKSYLN